MDDPAVMAAAEALSGLGNPDFSRSPTSRSNTLGASPTPTNEPEPLLQLLTSNHPWLGGTINGSISAYNVTKGYTPGFVLSGVSLLERIGSPVVSSVGRVTGAEQSLRRYLGEVHRRPSDIEAGDIDATRKRQRVRGNSPGSDAMDVEPPFKSPRTRGGSQSSYAESLPAYDDQRSPQYEESAVVVVDPTTGKEMELERTSNNRRTATWSEQTIISFSALGVALSDTSLRSLKACLRSLHFATSRIDEFMHALKQLLDEYATAIQNRRQSDGEASGGEKGDVAMTNGTTMDSGKEDRARQIADQMKSLSGEIWRTLQSVVNTVSRYTGGALPDNARRFVRSQLLSVPQRWQLAARSADREQRGDDARSAQRMLAFAREGLDMISQITTVVDGTVQGAEGWLARIGRRPQENGESSASTNEKQGLIESSIKEEK